MLVVCIELRFIKSNVELTLFEISGIRRRVFEIFALMRCYTALPTSTFNIAQQRLPQVDSLLHRNNKVALNGI
jgi:uncharacterized protein with PQ loop repeat